MLDRVDAHRDEVPHLRQGGIAATGTPTPWTAIGRELSKQWKMRLAAGVRLALRPRVPGAAGRHRHTGELARGTRRGSSGSLSFVIGSK
jgi:hypothetical protein